MRARIPKLLAPIAGALLPVLLATGCAGAPWIAGERRSKPRATAGFEVTAVPTGWCTSELQLAPDDEGKRSITIQSPDGSSNVIASSEPLGPGVGTSTYADSQGALLREEFERYRELEERQSRAYQGAGRERVFTWLPPDGDMVWQVQAYASRDDVGYTSTGTTLASSPVAVRQQLRRIVASVRLVSGTVDTPARCNQESIVPEGRST